MGLWQGVPGEPKLCPISSRHQLLQPCLLWGAAKSHLRQSFANPRCLRHFREDLCKQLCRQPQGEGKLCWRMAMSRNGGTGPASAPALPERWSCTLGARLHIKDILYLEGEKF